MRRARARVARWVLWARGLQRLQRRLPHNRLSLRAENGIFSGDCMRRTAGFVWALLLVATSIGHVHGAERTYSAEAIAAAVHADYPDAKVLESAEGDLDGDSLPDVAVCVGLQGDEQMILVLRGTRAETLARWEHSQRFPWPQQTPDVEIRKGSLFLSSLHISLDTVSRSTSQYRLRHGQFQLIGDESWTQSPVQDDEPGPKASSRVSNNYLTGVSITVSEPGKRMERGRSRLPNEALQTLQDYLP